MPLPRVTTIVPPAWPVRLEIVRAIQTLAKQIEENERRRNAKQVTAVNPDCDLIAEAFREFYQELRKASFNPDEPRVPAGNPDGGQWTKEGGAAGNNGNGSASVSGVVLSDTTPENRWLPGAQYAANDLPEVGRREPPEIPRKEPAAAQLRNALLKSAAYFLADLLLAEESIGWYLAALQAIEWLSEHLPWITAYLDQPKTWEELQQNALRKRPGYDIHHPVEQTPASDDGFPDSLVDGPDNSVARVGMNACESAATH